MTPAPTPDQRTVTTVLEGAEYERFQAACKAESRSMSKQLARLVAQWLDGRKGKK